MSIFTAYNIPTAVKRLRQRDSTLKHIDLDCGCRTGGMLVELTDCLLANPNIITRLYLNNNKLTNEIGVKLAQYIATSSTIEWLDLSNNRCDSITYLAMAAALQVNTSLRYLYLYDNRPVDCVSVKTAFINALILNPDRPICSWYLFDLWVNEYHNLKKEAEQLGHPNMQSLLATSLLRTELFLKNDQ